MAEYVTRMLRMFGLGEGSPIDSRGEKIIGWGMEKVEGESGQGVDVSFYFLPIRAW